MDCLLDGWMDGFNAGWLGLGGRLWMDGFVGGWVGRWMHEWMDFLKQFFRGSLIMITVRLHEDELATLQQTATGMTVGIPDCMELFKT